MEKIEKDYASKYGGIPKTIEGRIDYILQNTKLSRQKYLPSEIIEKINKIKWHKLSYTIYLLPKGTPRPRAGANGVFYVKGAKDHKKVFRRFWEDISSRVDIIKTATRFKCDCYLPTPTSGMTKSEQVAAELGYIRPLSKPDWDNLAKTYCDMIQGYLLYEDAFIIDGSTSKYYSILPRIEIEIEYASDYDSDFNRRKIQRKEIKEDD